MSLAWDTAAWWPECDVCQDTTGEHELWCPEGGGPDMIADTVRLYLSDFRDVSVEWTGGGSRAVMACDPDTGREVWVTCSNGARIAPMRAGYGWMVGVYPTPDAAYADPESAAYFTVRGTTMFELRMALAAACGAVV